jgi:hypothetical protein
MAANEAKSVSLSEGAGADGDIGAFNGMLIGSRVDGVEDEEEDRIRVGAVEPPVRRGFRPDPP